MTAPQAPQIPFELRSLNSAQAGELLGYCARHVRERLAARPDFPKRCDAGGDPRWKAGDILAWRDRQQRGRK
jgi:hypothetical protein